MRKRFSVGRQSFSPNYPYYLTLFVSVIRPDLHLFQARFSLISELGLIADFAWWVAWLFCRQCLRKNLALRLRQRT
jgi:hypothetical protein